MLRSSSAGSNGDEPVSRFTVKFLGAGTGPLRSESVAADDAMHVGRLAAGRLGSSRVFTRAQVFEGQDLRLEVDRAGYRRVAG
jgi:hypothetical protein